MNPLAAEFVALMRRLKWSQSETARQLFVTASHINQIVNGKAEPSAAMLQLLKLTAARQRPDLTGTAGAAMPVRKADPLEEFCAELRRQRLDKLSPADQRKLVRALAEVAGVELAASPKSEARSSNGRKKAQKAQK
jgi:transcriptional regulator with XRE-family HTH domain